MASFRMGPNRLVLSDSIGLSSSETVGLILAVVSGGTILILIIFTITFVCRCVWHRHTRHHSNIPNSPSSSTRLPEGRISKLLAEGDATSPIKSNGYNVDTPTTTDTQLAVMNQPLTNTNGADRQNFPPPPPTEEELELRQRQEFIESRQFPREDLLLQEKLGEGEYGPIYRGEAYGLSDPGQSRPVTVKMLTQQATDDHRMMFDLDIEMLSAIHHLHVVKILALCTKDTPECIILDAGLPGDLLTFVRDKKRDTSPLISTEEETQELLKIADEIALGMAYLSSERFIHKDLAARNCIVGYNGVVKIAHFGLGPLIYPEAYYHVQDNDLPVRWMPPEAITSANFTMASDVWSYGVILWELFTYGDLPFDDKTNEEVVRFIVKDLGKLACPVKCPTDIFDIMEKCWNVDPGVRPNFVAIHEMIGDFIGDSAGMYPSPLTSPSAYSGMGIDAQGFEAETTFQ